MHVILTGATGVVGSAALSALLGNAAVTKISIISRGPVPAATSSQTATDKCRVITHKDFKTELSESALEELKDARGVIWSLGVSQNEVNEEKYREITHDYAMVAARSFAKLVESRDPSANDSVFNFLYISGEGATTTPKWHTMLFGRVKGETELALLQLGRDTKSKAFRVYSARPGGVDPYGHKEVEEWTRDRQVNWKLKALRASLSPVLRVSFRGILSPTKPLGEALSKIVLSNGEPFPAGPGILDEGRIISNVGLRAMTGW